MPRQRPPSPAFRDWRAHCRDIGPLPFTAFWREYHADYTPPRLQRRMKISHSHLAALMEHGTVSIRDDEHQPDDARFRTAGTAASLDMLGVALARLDRSAARQRPPRCADCTEDLPEHHHGLCDECAARRHELAA